MKSVVLFGAVLATASEMESTSNANPVRRIVGLLKGLQDDMEKALKDEEKAFMKTKCLAESTIRECEATIDENTQKINEKKDFVAEIDSGAINFTTEESDLTKQLGDKNSALETAKATRKQEKADYEAADAELQEAIEALNKSVTILETEGKVGQTAFLSSKTMMGVRMKQRAALEVVKPQISFAEYEFLLNALNREQAGQPEKKDWDMLNKDDTFKQKYKTKSDGILATIKNLQKSFTAEKSEADDAEDKAIKDFDELEKKLEKEIEALKKALIDAEEETAAKKKEKEAAENLIGQMEAENSTCETTISDNKKLIKNERKELGANQVVRREEISAINKAIGILNSGDARDTFSSSFKSQGYFFVQTALKSNSKVVEALKKAGATSAQVTEITSGLAKEDPTTEEYQKTLDGRKAEANSGMADVVDMIQKYMTTLGKKIESDQTTLNDCIKAQNDDNEEAAEQSRTADLAIEKAFNAKNSLEASQEAIRDQIEKLKEARKTIQELKEAWELYEKTWKETDKMDGEAISLIESAIEALSPAVNPKTVSDDASYKGEASESGSATKGIVSIMEMVKDDVKKDKKKHKEEMEETQTAWQKNTEEQEDLIVDYKATITSEGENVGEKREEIATQAGERSAADKLIASAIEAYQTKESSCDFMMNNLVARKTNMQEQIAVMRKAINILKAGENSGDFE